MVKSKMVGLYRHSLGDGFQSMCRVFFPAGMDGHNYINHLYRYNPLNNPCFDHTTYSTTYNWRYSMAVRHHMIIIHLSPQNWMHGFMRVAMNHNESPRLDGFIGGNDDVFGWSIYPLFSEGLGILRCESSPCVGGWWQSSRDFIVGRESNTFESPEKLGCASMV